MARVLILRPASDAGTTAADLVALGHVPLVLPLQEVVPLDIPPPGDAFGGVLVTSAHAVGPLARAFPRDGRPVLAVGGRTAALLRASGFGDVAAGAGTGAALAEPARAVAMASGLPLLYAAGRVRTAGLEAALGGLGVPFVVWEVYDTRALEPDRATIASALGAGAPDAVLLLSVGQAEAFSRLALGHRDPFRPMPELLCLSRRIFDALAVELRSSAAISGEPDLAALFDRIR